MQRRDTDLDGILVVMLELVKLLELESLCPSSLVQVHQHALLSLGLLVVDRDRVVVSVQSVDQRLDRRLVEVSNVSGRLTRLLASHLERSERISVQRQALKRRGRGVGLTSICGLMSLNASMTTFPLTDWIGSMTIDTARGFNCSNDCVRKQWCDPGQLRDRTTETLASETQGRTC